MDLHLMDLTDLIFQSVLTRFCGWKAGSGCSEQSPAEHVKHTIAL